MNKKVLFNISAVVIYAILITSIIIVFKKKDFSPYNCYRFCSTNKNESDNDLMKKFSLTEKMNDYDEYSIKIRRGPLSLCSATKYILKEDRGYEFNYGELRLDQETFSCNRYCIEYDKGAEIEWKVQICDDSFMTRGFFHYLSIIISIILLLCPLIVISSFSELRDFHGKCMISFVVSQILVYLFIAFLSSVGFRKRPNHFIIFGLGTCFAMTILCLSVMIFTNFWTFKMFRNNKKYTPKFSTWALIGGFFMLYAVVATFFDFLSYDPNFIAVYVTLVLSDIAMLILTGIIIFVKSRRLEQSEHAYFISKKKQYFDYLRLFAIMFLTWPFELISWTQEFEQLDLIGIDFLKIFTALVIFGLVLGKNKVQTLIFNKYHGLSNAAEQPTAEC